MMWKRRLLRLGLVVLSIIVALAIGEVVLAIDGRYNALVARGLVPSPAIWEPRAGVTEEGEHPDLAIPISVTTDAVGVRNHTSVRTDQKTRIVGFFGDSHTENRRVEDRFSVTSLLDGTMEPHARVVNYGVDGYGLDQSYIRYKKYEAHDIRHVVYLFCNNDLRNLYETGLVQVTPDKRLSFRQPGVRWPYRVLGRIRLTYLVLSAYHAVAGAPEDSDPTRWAEQYDDRQKRFHDATAESINNNLLSVQPATRPVQLVETFVLLLTKWREEVEARGRTFTVLILPRQKDTDVAHALLRSYNGRVIYLREHLAADVRHFKVDDHWNEYGNLEGAELLIRLVELPFHGDIVKPEYLHGWTSRIDQYYDKHRRRP